MKIGLVSDSYYPHYSGTSELMFHTSLELQKLGHRVKIVTAGHHGEKNVSEKNVIRLGRTVLVPIHETRVTLTIGTRLPFELRRILDKEDFDILHIYGPLGPVLPLLCLILSKTVNIGNFHTQFDRSLAYAISKPLLQRWSRRLHGRIAVSRAARDSFAGYLPGDYRLIPIGVDTERFSPKIPRLAKLADRGPNLLFVGRFDPRKGLEYLLKAFPLILRKHPSARLIVVGGERPPGSYLKHMDPRVAQQLHFEGKVPPNAMASYYASCDIYCSPATGKESFGIVLLEAMASGIPVVASDIAGYREVISDGRDGILVKPRDPQAIASAVSDLLFNPNLRDRLRQNGRAKAQQFSWETVAKLIQDYYFEIREKVAWLDTQ